MLQNYIISTIFTLPLPKKVAKCKWCSFHVQIAESKLQKKCKSDETFRELQIYLSMLL